MFVFVMAMLLTFLGIIGNFGCHVYSIKEVSFIPYTRLGFADVIFFCDAVFNPVLYPYYWLQGYGRLNSEVEFIYKSEHPNWFSDTTSGGPNMETDSEWYPWGWGITPKERYEAYTTYLLCLGFYPNFAFLLVITSLIEIITRRLYLPVFAGIWVCYWSH
jgi:hypothetical protein